MRGCKYRPATRVLSVRQSRAVNSSTIIIIINIIIIVLINVGAKGVSQSSSRHPFTVSIPPWFFPLPVLFDTRTKVDANDR